MDKSLKRQTTKAKKVYNIVTTVLVLAIFLLLAVTLGVVLYRRTHGGEVSLFGYYMYDVLSDSMQPTVKVGEVIIARKVEDVGALKVGDIITFVAPSGQIAGYNITHRIVEIALKDDGSVDFFKTKGDSPSAGIDEWQLSPSDVKAKFVRVSPFLTGFKNFIVQWYGYVVLVVIPVLLAGCLIIGGFVRERRAAKNAEESEAVSGDIQQLAMKTDDDFCEETESEDDFE